MRVYFQVYPDGVERQSWPGITYVRVRPTWARYSDFREGSRCVVEWSGAELAVARGLTARTPRAPRE